MKYAESILHPVKHIHGGAMLEHYKNTADFETVTMPSPDTVYIPLSQHIGAPCEPRVSVGDQVFVGTVIGDSDAAVSAPIHSSVSGTVKEIADKDFGGRTVKCIVIESDGKDTPDITLAKKQVNTAEDLIKAARDCGLVGLGGAGFPTHIKLNPSPNCRIDTLIINCAECEPYITSDYRESIENFGGIIEGVYLIKRLLRIKKVVICIERNKPKAIEKLMLVAADHRDADDSVKVMQLPDKYPQGAEKTIIYSATGRKLPLGKLPSDIGCIVMNITSVGTLYKYISTGMPLVEKRITVDGTAVRRPKNLLVKIGTPIKDVLEFVGGIHEKAEKVIAGGPMMGSCVVSTSAVVEKRTNAITVMKEQKKKPQTPCIRCGRCASACPMNLYPANVEAALNSGLYERFENLNVNYCMECGCCSFVCPAARPLTQVMRVAKQSLRRNKK